MHGFEFDYSVKPIPNQNIFFVLIQSDFSDTYFSYRKMETLLTKLLLTLTYSPVNISHPSLQISTSIPILLIYSMARLLFPYTLSTSQKVNLFYFIFVFLFQSHAFSSPPFQSKYLTFSLIFCILPFIFNSSKFHLCGLLIQGLLKL